jgi:hypothetical protein
MKWRLGSKKGVSSTELPTDGHWPKCTSTPPPTLGELRSLTRVARNCAISRPHKRICVRQTQSGWNVAHRYRDTNPLECTPDVSDNHSFQRQATRSGLPRRSVTCSAYHDKSIAHDIAMARRSTCPLHGNMVDYGQHTHVRRHVRPARDSVGNEHKGDAFPHVASLCAAGSRIRRRSSPSTIER